MIESCIDYLVKDISVAILITLLLVAYINIVVIYIPPPEGTRKEIMESLSKAREVLLNISTPQDMFMYMLKNGLYMIASTFIPIVGSINYIGIVTEYAWGIAIDIHAETNTIGKLLALISTPTLYLQLTSYSLVTIEGNKVLIDIIKRNYGMITWIHHAVTVAIAIAMMVTSITLDTFLVFFSTVYMGR